MPCAGASTQADASRGGGADDPLNQSGDLSDPT